MIIHNNQTRNRYVKDIYICRHCQWRYQSRVYTVILSHWLEAVAAAAAVDPAAAIDPDL